MIVFMEESIVEHMHMLIPVLNAVFIEDDTQKQLKDKAKSILQLMGRFAPASAFAPICMSIINMKLTDNEELAVCGLSTYKHLLAGYLEALPSGEGLLDKADLVKSTIKDLGAPAYLDQLTKYMLNPFSELFELLFTKISELGSNSDQSTILTEYRSESVRICLTALSIPIFMLTSDNSVEVNFKLIKSSIENTAKLTYDKDAEYYLKIVKSMIDSESTALIDVVNAVDGSKVGRSSNDMTIICSTVNYCMMVNDIDNFEHAVMVFEGMAKQKDTMAKLVINMNSYMNFYVNHDNHRSRST